MDFESPDVEKDFPGLYASESAHKKSQDHHSDYSDEEKVSRKDLLIGKRKERKESKKDKGYVAFEGESSEDDADAADAKSPMRHGKKTKGPFKFSTKDKKDDKKKKKETEKKKEKKVKLGGLKQKKKKPKQHPEEEKEEKPIFGVPLQVAVERNRSQDGIELPVVVRECIDYIEEHGLASEGIYRLSGVKSKVQQLRAKYNRGEQVFLYEHEPHVVASLLKQFLRDLPEPVLTNELVPKFEEAAGLKDAQKREETLQKLLKMLPPCNYLLLSWVFVHMLHVIQMEKRNKMNLQNVSIVLSPTMQISHRVLHALFQHSDTLFQGVHIKKYCPMRSETSRQSLEMPDTPATIEEELARQENVLSELHAELNAGLRDKHKEEQLWEVQRIVTQLKRKLRFLKQMQEKSKPPPEAASPQDSKAEGKEKDEFHIDARLQEPVKPPQEEKAAKEAEEEQPQQVSEDAPAEEVIPKEVLEESIPTSEEQNRQSDLEVAAITEKSLQAPVAPKQEEKVEDIAPKEAEEDAELHALLREEQMLLLQQEELLLLGEELRKKINAEQLEVERLKAEIAEYQQLYKYKQYSFDSSENSSSSESDSSESVEEEDLQQVLDDLVRANRNLEEKNASLSRRIQRERETCMDIKVQMKMLHQEAATCVLRT